MDIIRVLAHALALIIRYLGNIHAVTCCSLHNYVERFIARIVGYICSYSKCDLDLVLEIAVEFVCFLEIKAVAEQKCLGLWIKSKLLIMMNHLVAPLIRIATVVSHPTEKCRICELKILQEAICCNGISESCSVQNSILLNPCIHNNIDSMLQVIIQNALAGVKEIPESVRNLVDLNSTKSTYDFIEDLLQTAYNDIAVPMLNDQTMKWLGQEIDKDTTGTLAGLLNRDFRVSAYTVPAGSTLVAELNNIAGGIVNGLLKNYNGWVSGDNSKLTDNVVAVDRKSVV